ncbi:Qat anti-phage system TatD family nuclease QatD [Pseudovibrio brasiliensis]|uniref:TatD family hydrolase n=1 Tax=Pseudovibrio brasiliensis TaxID=1898042 RepID=A0ABX8AVH7_9HYPH|nr:Qat anti-phage system TatD family nuclease QatD [Pseudovibrio brasiliensis]QUS59048.1 TatD family hydrolase [Pseudovibrio brasiliensis]
MRSLNQLVDYHCHIDLYPDYKQIMRECDTDGVATLAVTTTPLAWERNIELASTTQNVRVALGLHPQLVADRAHEISLWNELLPKARFIGEVGLDASPRFYRSFEKQKDVFQHILRACSRSGDKILSVHSVRATKIVLDMIEKNLPETRGRAVLHWFTGTSKELRRAVELGCYFSINAAMLTSDKKTKLVAEVPLDRVLTETDGPFTQSGNRPSKPSDVSMIVNQLAKLHRIPEAEMISTITQNLQRLEE